VERITALYIGRVGDVIVATSFLRALRRRYPKARIRLIAGWRSAQVLPLVPFIDESLILEKPERVGANLAFAWSLLSEPCDLLVDLNSSYSRTSSLIARASRAPRRLAFQKGRGPVGVFTELLAAPAEREHMWDRYGRLAAALDAPYDQDPELRLPGADVEEAKNLLAGPSSAGSGPFKLVVHPGNFDRFSFRWPEEKFAALADRLLDDARLQLFFMGGPGEREKVAEIVARLKRPVPILPAARLGVSGGMLKQMNLLVCNITGTTHLATALGVPTFGFYAGYTQAVWRPRGARHGGTVCSEWESCRETTVDEAYTALADHIKRLSPL
jgi:ADP-heptose:LPS heptosyltransferase